MLRSLSARPAYPANAGRKQAGACPQAPPPITISETAPARACAGPSLLAKLEGVPTVTCVALADLRNLAVLSRECEAASGSTTPGWHHPAILSTQSSGRCILHLASSNEALPHGTLDHRVNNFVGGQGVSLDDFIRIFRCDGAVGYALVGFVLFSIACEVNSRMRGWDSYRSRFLFLVYGTVGFLIGGGVYLISQGHCTASAPVVAALPPI